MKQDQSLVTKLHDEFNLQLKYSSHSKTKVVGHVTLFRTVKVFKRNFEMERCSQSD